MLCFRLVEDLLGNLPLGKREGRAKRRPMGRCDARAAVLNAANEKAVTAAGDLRKETPNIAIMAIAATVCLNLVNEI